MSKYIKLDDAIEHTNQLYHGYEVEKWLESLPTIDIVECGDCVFWGDNICKARRSYTYEDEFCSFVIRRKDIQ